MDQTKTKYIDLLFKPDEWVNVCKDSVKEIKTYPVQVLPEGGTWICVNPLVPSSTRKRANLHKYRNFLIEFDDIPVEEQLEYVESLGLPYTTAVFSGNKSVHFVIALSTDISVEYYIDIQNRLKKCVEKCDKSCLEPARLTRMPGPVQTLLASKEKVDIEELEGWLSKHFKPSPTKKFGDNTKKHGRITRRALNFLGGLVHTTEAHSAAIHTTKTLIEMGFEYDIIVQMLIDARQLYLPEESVDIAKERTEKVVNWVYSEWNNE